MVEADLQSASIYYQDLQSAYSQKLTGLAHQSKPGLTYAFCGEKMRDFFERPIGAQHPQGVLSQLRYRKEPLALFFTLRRKAS